MTIGRGDRLDDDRELLGSFEGGQITVRSGFAFE
jgi:hypothetical protein